MSSPPTTPRRNLISSSIDRAYSPASPQPNGDSSPPDVFGQDLSPHKMRSSSASRADDPTILKSYADPPISAFDGGYGNLAEELADAWDEDIDVEPIGDTKIHCRASQKGDLTESNGQSSYGQDGDFIQSSPALEVITNLSLATPIQSKRFAPRRRDPEFGDLGHGGESDSENPDIKLYSLQACTAAVEKLTQKVVELNGSEIDGVINRVADSLKDLPSQSAVENGTTRLITAHSALTTHLSHQTRSILTLTHAILSPLSASPDPDMIDELLPLLTSLVFILPFPNAQCLSSLHGLHTSTADLQSTLTYLSDTIYMTRQTMTVGMRKLKIASEILLEMRREVQAREEAVRWIAKGGWDQRLANRDCAKICVDVVGGFEKACDKWRERLVCETGLDFGVA